ncbi:MAG: DUF3291 domain-containing protein [Rudanella sp.]|nr:DUF3291 domain-containing protein [Rudanella sp.]
MPIITVTVLQYRPGARLRAFANMGRVMMKPFVAEGLTFHKLLGSGHNLGLMPNFSTYVFLGVWDTETQAEQFLASAQFEILTQGTDDVSTLYLEPYQAHGSWDGVNPFSVSSDQSRRGTAAVSSNGSTSRKPSGSLVAVLTRATIRPGALFEFWRNVPAVRQKMADHKDNLLFAIGVGEKPVVQQCTISVWRSSEAINQFAYRQSGHKEVVRESRTRHWFNEDLFARFRVRKVSGSMGLYLNGISPETAKHET